MSLKSFNVKAKVTATSDKQNAKFVQSDDQKRKSIYLTADAENSKILEDHGLTKYTSKEDNTPFFVVKASKNIRVYEKGEKEVVGNISGVADVERNFSTEGEAMLNFIVGEKMNNEYVRLSAIQVGKQEEIVFQEAHNPFE